MSDTPQSETPETDALIEEMLSGNGVPKCNEWDPTAMRLKGLERITELADELDAAKHDIARCVQTNTDLLQELEKVKKERERLVLANEHWHTRIEQEKTLREDAESSRDRALALLGEIRRMLENGYFHIFKEFQAAVGSRSEWIRRIDALKEEG